MDSVGRYLLADIRSLRPNTEMTLIASDAPFGGAVREFQLAYVAQSESIDLARWLERGHFGRLREDSAQLVSPLH